LSSTLGSTLSECLATSASLRFTPLQATPLRPALRNWHPLIGDTALAQRSAVAELRADRRELGVQALQKLLLFGVAERLVVRL
jgi:hypothetical protein